MKIKFILHENINRNILLDIVSLKKMAWPYTMDEQLEWVKKNIKNEDIHVFLINDKKEIMAYLNLIKIKLIINNIEQGAFGIGNVCARQKGNGDGEGLLKEVNKYLIDIKTIGLLFCQDKLIHFYERLDWKIIDKKSVTINELTIYPNVLLYNFNDKLDKLVYNGYLF